MLLDRPTTLRQILLEHAGILSNIDAEACKALCNLVTAKGATSKGQLPAETAELAAQRRRLAASNGTSIGGGNTSRSECSRSPGGMSLRAMTEKRLLQLAGDPDALAKVRGGDAGRGCRAGERD